MQGNDEETAMEVDGNDILRHPGNIAGPDGSTNKRNDFGIYHRFDISDTVAMAKDVQKLDVDQRRA
jgi:hypothetical protein